MVGDGASIQSAINANGAGTTFCISGFHAITTAIIPKAGDVLAGEPGATLDGGNVAPVAVDGNGGSDVTVKGLLIQHFKNASQVSAVGGQAVPLRWVIRDNEVAFNATIGIRVGPGSQVINNKVHDNGQEGMSGYRSNGALISGNEVYNNNPTCAFNVDFEAGGMKFYSAGVSTSLTITNNNIHDNCGPGIWTDTDVTGGQISNNTVTNTRGHGIEIEISCNLSVTGNTVSGSTDTAIFVSTSHNTTVSGNTVSGGNHGIRIWAADRPGEGTVCGNRSDSNVVTDNMVSVGGGVSGLYLYTGVMPTGNAFSRNTYHSGSCSANHWQWASSRYTFSPWQSLGQDATGSCGP